MALLYWGASCALRGQARLGEAAAAEPGWHDAGGTASNQVWPASNAWSWDPTNVPLYMATDLWAVSRSYVLSNWSSATKCNVTTQNWFSYITGLADPASNIVEYFNWYNIGQASGTNFWLTNLLYIPLTNMAVQTNLSLQPRDLLGYELFKAATERWMVISTNNAPLTNFPAGARPQFYTFYRGNLVAMKSWLSGVVSYFVDPGAQTGGTFNAWFAQYHTYPGGRDFPMLQLLDTTNIYFDDSDWKTNYQTGLLKSLGLPTNYLTYTPWNQLNGSGIPEYHSNTGKLYFASTVTNPLVWWPDNTQTTLSGVFTNGQTNTFTWTNADIAIGNKTNGQPWSSLDYGYQGAHDLLNQMHLTALARPDPGWANLDGTTNGWDGYNPGGPTHPWTSAQTNAEGNWRGIWTTTAPAENRSVGYNWGDTPNDYDAWLNHTIAWAGSSNLIQTSMTNGAALSVYWYNIPGVDPEQQATNWLRDMTSNGDNVVISSNFVEQAKTNYDGQGICWFKFGTPPSSVKPPWCVEPLPLFTYAEKGWKASPAIQLLFDWAVTNGFMYR